MPYHILLVEDDPSLNRLLALVLRQAGFDVATVDDGEAALDYLAQKPADAMILDFNLPGINGMDVIRHVRLDERLRRLRILGLTANPSAANTPEAAQADILLMKPVSNSQLITMLKRLVGDTGPLSE